MATNEKSIIQTSNQQYEINIGHERQKILWPQQQKHQMPFFSFYATYLYRHFFSFFSLLWALYFTITKKKNNKINRCNHL